MNNLEIDFAAHTSLEQLLKMNKKALRIFDWICSTLNAAGHVPYIYECEANYMEFLIKKKPGSKISLRWDMQMKIVSFANYMFRIKQKEWPVRLTEDVRENKFIKFFSIKVPEKPDPTFEIQEDLYDDSEHTDEHSQQSHEAKSDELMHE